MLFTNIAVGVKIEFLGNLSKKYRKKTIIILSDEEVLE